MTDVVMDPGAVVDALLRTGAKGAVLMAAVAVVTLTLRRGSAAGRHLVWFLGTMALLALPFLEVAAPEWRVELPVVRAERPVETAPAPTGGEGPDAIPGPAPTEAGGGPAAGIPAAWVSGIPGSSTTSGVRSSPEPAVVEVAPEAAVAAGGPETAVDAGAREVAAGGGGAGAAVGASDLTPGGTGGAWPTGMADPLVVAVGGWLVGALLLLLSLLRSTLAVRRVAREAVPFGRGRVRRLAAEAAERLGISRPVRILRGVPDAMPMSFGILRPAVLLPDGAQAWDARRLEAVLLHELAHVRRRDSLTQALAEVARALHWFDPLVWLAVRRLRVEREHACDDRVLAAGARPSRYAEELLSLVRGFRLPRHTGRVAVAMARRGDLRRRLRAVLEEGRPRTLSRRGVGTAVLVVGLVATPLAAVTPAPAATEDGADPAAQEDAADPAAQDVVSRDRRTTVPFTGPVQEATCGMASMGWESTSHQSNDERHRLEWRRDGCEVEVLVEGEVEFTADFRDVRRLGPGALLRIEEDDDGTDRRVEVRPGAGGEPGYTYRVDGRDRPFDPEARAWFEGMLLQVFRRGGFMAGERVQALLDQGGVQAVLDELEVLDADHVFARYVQELLSRADPGEDRVVQLLDRARARVDSDHYLSGILEAAALGRPLSDRLLDATLRASRDLESDHYRAGVLSRVLERSDLDAGRVATLLSSASEIGSDHYLSEILVGVAERYVLQPEVRADYLAAARSLDSDHYRASVLTGLMARSDLTDAELAEVLRAARDIDSDHYVAEVLEDVARDGLPPGPLQDAYFEVAGDVGSDHYRGQVLADLLRSRDVADPLLVRVLDSVARMGSDHYKAELLVEIAEGRRLEGGTRDAFLGALESIGSSHYRGRVSEALVRAGG